MNRNKGIGRNSGFTMIEVLVALLILLIGLLGVAGMQYLSLKQVNNSNLRSQVNLHTEELIEAIRANGGDALDASEVTAWEHTLLQSVPGATSTITFDNAAGTVRVTVAWKERQLGDDEADQTFSMLARMKQ